MNIYTPYSSTVSESFTFPGTVSGDAASATVSYEWGDAVVSGAATSGASGVYTYNVSQDLIDSAGLYKIKWDATVNGNTFYAYTQFQVENQYIDEATFMDLNPNFDIPGYKDGSFDLVEKLARYIIDTHTGQSFQPVINKTLTFDGNGRDTLYTYHRVNSINSLTFTKAAEETDYTDVVEIDRQAMRYIKIDSSLLSSDSFSSVFPKTYKIVINGDWGWLYVPENIKQAANLLIIDLFEDVRRENFRYGIQRLWQDTNRMEMLGGFFETTGNLDVDVLLMDYVFWVPDYIT